MGADHYISTAFGKPSERLRPLSTRIAPGEKRQSQPRGLAELGERLIILAGKNFGRHHQRRLTSRLDHRCHGKERDESLAGSNIALQKPQHAGWRRKVRVDFAERGFLRSRQSERQAVCNLFSDMAVPRARARRIFDRIKASANWEASNSSKASCIRAGASGAIACRVAGRWISCRACVNDGTAGIVRTELFCHSGKRGNLASAAWTALPRVFCNSPSVE